MLHQQKLQYGYMYVMYDACPTFSNWLANQIAPSHVTSRLTCRFGGEVWVRLNGCHDTEETHITSYSTFTRVYGLGQVDWRHATEPATAQDHSGHSHVT